MPRGSGIVAGGPWAAPIETPIPASTLAVQHAAAATLRLASAFTSGSGVQALVAARCYAHSVEATDVNPRALRFVAFNARLNGLAHKVVATSTTICTAISSLSAISCHLAGISAPPPWRHQHLQLPHCTVTFTLTLATCVPCSPQVTPILSDVYAALPPSPPYDAILANPPFVAVPPPPPGAPLQAEWALYADGGAASRDTPYTEPRLYAAQGVGRPRRGLGSTRGHSSPLGSQAPTARAC